MDLTKKGLPNVVMINGSLFPIYTDFRLWMRFEIEVARMKRGQSVDVSYLFKNEKPPHCNLMELFAFSRPASELPRALSHSDVVSLDFAIDADYIYSAFLSQYGIDLMEADMHWHKFLALLKGLKEDEMLSKIMSYRNYVKSRENRDIYEELRYAWQIEFTSEEEEEEIERFSRYFDVG